MNSYVLPNIRNILVTLEVSHDPIGLLKLLAFRNISDIFVIRVVTMLLKGTGDACPDGVNALIPIG